MESSKHLCVALAQTRSWKMSQQGSHFLLAVATMDSPTVLIPLPLPKAAGDQRQVSSLFVLNKVPLHGAFPPLLN